MPNSPVPGLMYSQTGTKSTEWKFARISLISTFKTNELISDSPVLDGSHSVEKKKKRMRRDLIETLKIINRMFIMITFFRIFLFEIEMYC